jgi:acyl-CoA dehydrogenase
VIDFELPGELRDLQERTAAFVRDVVIGIEPRDQGTHGLDDGLRAELQALAREAGLFAPTMPAELGGLGLDVRGQSVVLEEAGYSLLGPQALNCAAPDEGNMHLLERVATEAQRERYLRPLAAGETRSCFAMTEPPPGAGSDPGMLLTTATRQGDGWRIDGTKWFITGAEGAAFAIVMARTGERIEGDRGATMFLVDAGTPGFEILRTLDVIDRSFPGGHGEVRFDGCVVGDDAVLGEVGLGYRYAQVRLGPARLTHCMRWLGAARRALDTALDRVAEREAFGSPLGELGMAQRLIAESVIDIETSRALIQRAAWALDTGAPARHETGVAKAHVAEAVHRVVDRCVQLGGGYGVSHDGPLARLAAEIRPFRIYDGPTETHLWAIARRAQRRRAAERHGAVRSA